MDRYEVRALVHCGADQLSDEQPRKLGNFIFQEPFAVVGWQHPIKSRLRVDKLAGASLLIRLDHPLLGFVDFNEIPLPGSAVTNGLLEVIAGWEAPHLYLRLQGDEVSRRRDDARAAAMALALPFDLYETLKTPVMRRPFEPREDCEIRILAYFRDYLAAKYGLSDPAVLKEFLMGGRQDLKTGREQYLAYVTMSTIYGIDPSKAMGAIATPRDDRGTDIFTRLINFERRSVGWCGLQICEMPEEFLALGNGNFETALYDFVCAKKLKKYPRNNDMLIVWPRVMQNRDVNIALLRDLFDKFPEVPFSAVLLLSHAPVRPVRQTLVSTLWMRKLFDHFIFKGDHSTGKVTGIVGRTPEELANNEAAVKRNEFELKLPMVWAPVQVA
jgi:hypothetical protein